MYKCIKVREIESALCCLPSVPGQCNELASINMGDLIKLHWFPALIQQKKKKKKKNLNVQLCHLIIIFFQIIRSKEKQDLALTHRPQG